MGALFRPCVRNSHCTSRNTVTKGGPPCIAQRSARKVTAIKSSEVTARLKP